MYDKQMICEDGFKNVYDNKGKAIGFQLQVRICYYRGISITMVDRFDVSVDNVLFNKEDIRFGIDDKYFTFDELDNIEYNSVRWEFGEKATLFVNKHGGLAPGSHEVHVKQLIMVHYFPNQRSEAEFTKTMRLEN